MQHYSIAIAVVADAFNGFILPFPGFIFLPFTTLLSVFVFSMGGWLADKVYLI